jgi:hypothetical protein
MPSTISEFDLAWRSYPLWLVRISIENRGGLALIDEQKVQRIQNYFSSSLREHWELGWNELFGAASDGSDNLPIRFWRRQSRLIRSSIEQALSISPKEALAHDWFHELEKAVVPSCLVIRDRKPKRNDETQLLDEATAPQSKIPALVEFIRKFDTSKGYGNDIWSYFLHNRVRPFVCKWISEKRKNPNLPVGPLSEDHEPTESADDLEDTTLSLRRAGLAIDYMQSHLPPSLVSVLTLMSWNTLSDARKQQLRPTVVRFAIHRRLMVYLQESKDPSGRELTRLHNKVERSEIMEQRLQSIETSYGEQVKDYSLEVEGYIATFFHLNQTEDVDLEDNRRRRRREIRITVSHRGMIGAERRKKRYGQLYLDRDGKRSTLGSYCAEAVQRTAKEEVDLLFPNDQLYDGFIKNSGRPARVKDYDFWILREFARFCYSQKKHYCRWLKGIKSSKPKFGFSNQQIATILGVKVNHVGQLLLRAKRKLKEKQPIDLPDLDSVFSHERGQFKDVPVKSVVCAEYC